VGISRHTSSKEVLDRRRYIGQATNGFGSSPKPTAR